MDFSDDVQKSQSREYDIIFHFINGLVSFTTNISIRASLNDVHALTLNHQIIEKVEMSRL